MPKPDFFAEKCKDDGDALCFGIIDPEETKPAFLVLCEDEDLAAELCEKNQKERTEVLKNEDDFQAWHLLVTNPKKKDWVFVAIDHCLDLGSTDTLPKHCDALLEVKDESLFFVEIKYKRTSPISEGAQQIKSTIELFKESHQFSSYRSKYAVIANRSHPYFNTSSMEIKTRFRKETGFRLLDQATLAI